MLRRYAVRMGRSYRTIRPNRGRTAKNAYHIGYQTVCLMPQSPTITATRYVLAVQDLAKSADYYREQLGFETDWAGEGWHFLRRDAMFVMLGECPDDRSAFETRNHSYFAYVDVDNVDALYAELQERAVDILREPTDQPWGQREFSIRTIDGHRIMFGQAIEN